MSIEEVRTLVAERQRYDDWLTALEAKRADTPPRVYERVHGDYLGRRSEVIARLQAHVGTLSTLGSELEDRLGDLQARLAAHEEELAEGMLRNLVGEYDADRWESVRQDVEHKIQALGHERAALASEVEDVQTLLASARTLPVPEEVAVAEVVEEPAPVVAEPVVPSIMPADELEDTAEIAVPLAFASDEVVEDVATEIVAETIAVEAEQGDSLLDFDVSGIVENPTPQGARHEDVLADVAALFDTSSITAVPEPTAPTGAAPMDHAEFDDALALFGESTNEADAAFLRSLDGIVAEHDVPPRSDARGDSTTATATPPAAPNPGEPFDDLAFLRSVIAPGAPGTEPPPPAAAPAAPVSPATTNEPQKTLRCTECGTMNLPTEWYCERCGGELAAF
ncbi:hypothetical protein [Gemmatimonas sp.]|uniref:hypothetical protein n=1 Tax=Gemmatimonas sp. TaxID=1962908 RepID=UPI0037BE4BB7